MQGMNYEMYDENSPYIFISYAHADAKALKIIEELQQRGYNVWYDEGITPKSQWDEVIAEKVRKAGLFLPLLSKNYLESTNCINELDYARDKEIEILLVYLENVKIPERWQLRLGRNQHMFYKKYNSMFHFMEKFEMTEGIEEFRIVDESYEQEEYLPEVEVEEKVEDVDVAKVAEDISFLTGKLLRKIGRQFIYKDDIHISNSKKQISARMYKRAGSANYQIWILTILLLTISVIFNTFIWSSVMETSQLAKYIFYGITGFVLTVGVSRMQSRTIKKCMPILAILCIGFLVLLNIPEFSYGDNWIGLNGFSIRPQRFAMMAILPIMGVLAHNGQAEKDNNLGLCVLWGSGISIAMIGWHDLGYGVILCYMVLICGLVFYKGCKKLKIAGTVMGIIVGSMIVYSEIHLRTGEIKLYRYEWYQENILPILKSLTFFGKGFGKSKLVESKVVSSGDIFWVICEEMGILTGIIVIIMLGMFFYFVFRVCYCAKADGDIFGSAIACGVLIQGIFECIWNSTVLFSLMAYGLPFLSTGVGNSNIWWWMIEIGMVLVVWKNHVYYKYYGIRKKNKR